MHGSVGIWQHGWYYGGRDGGWKVAGENPIRCAGCGALLWPDEDAAPKPEFGSDLEQRTPCPHCGSRNRNHGRTLPDSAPATETLSAAVRRGVNQTRLAVFGLIFAAGSGVSLTVWSSCGVLWGLASGLAATVAMAGLVALVFRIPSVRHRVMDAMHRLTGS